MKKVLFKLTGIGILCLTLAIGWVWMDYRNFMQSPLNVPAEGYIFELKPGMNLTRLVYKLEDEKIIKRPRYLLWSARWHKNAHHLAVGEYRITHKDTAGEFLDNLLGGKVVQYSLSIIEGWSFKQLIQTINDNPHLAHELGSKTNTEIMQALGYPGIHPEGRFLPDTYYFPKGLTDTEFLRRAYQAMEDVLQKEWMMRDQDLAIKTPYDALILASIVEKETGLASERAAIAGVFMRRLKKGMRLQTDPTVIYGMGESYKGNIRRKDLEQDTPYNTYRRHGLPPTPIAMPGHDAIRAALHPQQGDSLYFVARGDGSHYFSSTLEEHNQAVIKYQLKGKKRSFSSYKNNSERKK